MRFRHKLILIALLYVTLFINVAIPASGQTLSPENGDYLTKSYKDAASKAFRDGLQSTGVNVPEMLDSESEKQDKQWSLDVDIFMTKGLGSKIPRNNNSLIAFDKVVRAVTSDPANSALSNQEQLEKAYRIFIENQNTNKPSNSVIASTKSDGSFGDAIKKAIGGLFIGIFSAIIAYRRQIISIIFTIAVSISTKLRNATEYIASDGNRAIIATLLFAIVFFGWMFRNEHVDKYTFRNRFTGQIFDSRD